MSVSKESSEGKKFVANWKKTGGSKKEQRDWVEGMGQERGLLEGKDVIVCPPLNGVNFMNYLLTEAKLPIAVGTQDIDGHIFDNMDSAKNTGYESPELLGDSAEYAILAHSETRKRNSLTPQQIADKVKAAQKAGLKPILCFEGVEQAEELHGLIGDYEGIVAYEPTWAIGTGKAATPEHASKMAEQIKKVFPLSEVLYGGSVDGTNIKGFMLVDGVLVGNNSLSPDFFKDILRNA